MWVSAQQCRVCLSASLCLQSFNTKLIIVVGLLRQKPCFVGSEGPVDLSADKYGGPTKQCLSGSRWVTSFVTDVTITVASSMVGMLSAKQKRTGCSRCALTSFQVCRSDSFDL